MCRRLMFASGAFILGITVMVYATSGLASGDEWVAPDDANEINNPIPVSEISILRGKELFKDHCITCHGKYGEGLKSEETGLKTDTADLSESINNHEEGGLFWKIRTGKGDMPSYADKIAEEDIWDVINYLKSGRK